MGISVEGSIPNLINGISQQTPAMRLPSQAELSINHYPTTVDGLTTRPPTEHISWLTEDFLNNAHTHFILRDEEERYVMAVMPVTGQIRVWDIATGNEVIVTNESPNYLLGVTKDDVRCMTVADHTFVVNTNKVVLEGTTYSATRPYEAMVDVRAGNYGRTYRIFINGTEAAGMHTPDGSDESHTAYIDTDYIAHTLRTALGAAHAAGGVFTDILDYGGQGGLGIELPQWVTDNIGPSVPSAIRVHATGMLGAAPWYTARYSHVIYIRNDTTPFTVTTEDGYSGKAMVAVNKKAQKFADLPTYGPDGVVMEVAGTDNNSFDNYWVKFIKENPVNSSGYWKECVAPGTRLGFNAATSPHVLVRNSNGTFTFKTYDYGERKCGDVEKAPDPTFVGQAISDVFFHKKRLGFLTTDNVILSQVADFGQFYRKTLTTLLDTDPIDVAVDHIKVSKLKHAAPYSGELILFSPETQFLLKGNELFTPKTVNAGAVSEMGSISSTRPVSAASSLYFATDRGMWSALMEYYLDKALQTADYNEVTGHCPAYIPSPVDRIVASPDISIIAVTSRAQPDTLFVYKYFYNGQEKLQSAWQEWRFPDEMFDTAYIKDLAFEGSTLYLLLKRSTGYHIEKLQCGVGRRDGALPYVIRLDQRIKVTNGQYFSADNTTVFHIPQRNVTYGGVLTRDTDDEAFPYTVGAEPGVLIVRGNHSGESFFFGREFPTRHRLSEIFLRGEDGKTSKVGGSLSIRDISLHVGKANSFWVEVTPEYRDTITYSYHKGDSKPHRFGFPVMSRSDRVTIDICTQSRRPSSFASAVWRGSWRGDDRES